MVKFVLALILFVVAIAAIIGIKLASSENKWIPAVVTAISVVLGGILLFTSMIRSVPTKSIGVQTSFGKVEGSVLTPGFHMTAPWTQVHILDETIQTTTFEGKNCLDVRIGGQQSACADVRLQWRVLDQSGGALYSDYAGQGGDIMAEIKNAVVVGTLKQALNDVLGDYNPIQDVSANSAAGNSQFSTFGPTLKAAMIHAIGGRIQVLNLTLPFLRYDIDTQKFVNKVQSQYAATATARQLQHTNQAQSTANAAIDKSLSPAVLQYQCLQITQEALNDGHTLPVGWSCFSNASSLALSSK